MKKFVIPLLLFSTLSFGSTISVNDGGGANAPRGSGGAILSTLNVYVGFFPGLPMDKINSHDLATVAASFVPIGVDLAKVGRPTGTIGASTITYTPSTGTWAGAATVTPQAGTANTFNANGLVAGTRLFVLMTEVPLAATPSENSSSTLWALVGADPLVSTAWAVPSSNLTNRTLNLSAVDVDSGPGNEYFHGTKGSIILAASIPEPTNFTLAGLAALGLVSRRRRA
jgi:hypothetical protein